MKPALNILVRPCDADYSKNRLFSKEHTPHYQHPFATLKPMVEARGHRINTWDMEPLESADVILIQDLPAREQFDEARKKAPNAKFILMVWETPLSRPHAWDKRNHDLFDAVLTYDRRRVDNKQYFFFPLSLGDAPAQVPQPAFADRKLLVLVSTNRWIGWLANRRGGFAGIPFFGLMFNGWYVRPWDVLTQDRGEQYTHRTRLARLVDREFPGVMDAWGPGWLGQPTSWAHRVIPHRPFACGKPPVPMDGTKHVLVAGYRFAIAFENQVTNRGYISEKIFDVLYAGSVPIYLGEERIADVVPAECFVDARQFKGDDRALLRFVQSCDEATWNRYRDAGQRYLQSDAIKAVQPPAFSKAVIDAIETVANRT